jgi:hypothetical protein
MSSPTEQTICASLSTYPVLTAPEFWLKAALELLAGCRYARAKLLLETVLQAHKEHVDAHILLVDTCLQLGSATWPEGLRVARSAAHWHPKHQHDFTRPYAHPSFPSKQPKVCASAKGVPMLAGAPGTWLIQSP